MNKTQVIAVRGFPCVPKVPPSYFIRSRCSWDTESLPVLLMANGRLNWWTLSLFAREWETAREEICLLCWGKENIALWWYQHNVRHHATHLPVRKYAMAWVILYLSGWKRRGVMKRIVICLQASKRNYLQMNKEQHGPGPALGFHTYSMFQFTSGEYGIMDTFFLNIIYYFWCNLGLKVT